MNIIEWMLDEKIATHRKQAQRIIVGLGLGELHRKGEYDLIKIRARLYRDHRNGGEKSSAAYLLAKDDKPVPVPLFDGVLHSEAAPKEIRE